MDTNNRDNELKDEISVGEMMVAAAELRVLVAGTVNFVFDALRKRWYIWLLLVVVGIGYGYYKYTMQHKWYYATMVINNTELTRKYYGELINNLQYLKDKGEDAQLALMLKMDVADIKNVTGFEGVNEYDQPLYFDNAMKPGIIKLTCAAETKEVYPKLQQAIMLYFNSNPYNVSRNELVVQKLKAEIEHWQAEIAKLDEMKESYNQFLRKGAASSAVTNLNIAPEELFKQTEVINDKLQDAVSSLKIYKPVELVQPFEITGKWPYKPLWFLLAKWTGVFFAGGIIASALTHFFLKD